MGGNFLPLSLNHIENPGRSQTAACLSKSCIGLTERRKKKQEKYSGALGRR
jgi:hypothetical protein